jgi:hypothetical protein
VPQTLTNGVVGCPTFFHFHEGQASQESSNYCNILAALAQSSFIFRNAEILKKLYFSKNFFLE